MPAQRPESDGDNHRAGTEEVASDNVFEDPPVTAPLPVLPASVLPASVLPAAPAAVAAWFASDPPVARARDGSVVPGRHLEDPEWTRALLALVAEAARAAIGPTPEMPLAWLIGADEAHAFAESAAPAPVPFASSPAGPSWSIAKDSLLVEHITPSATISASRRSGLVTAWRDESSRCLLDVVQARSLILDGPPVAVGFTLSDIVVELATRRWSDLEDVYLVGFGREMHGLENVRYLPMIADAISLLARLDPFVEGHGRCFVVAPMPTIDGQGAELPKLLQLAEQIPPTGVVCCDTSAPAHCTWHLAAHRQTLGVEVKGRSGTSAVLSPQRWVERTGEPLPPVVRSVRPEVAPAAEAARPVLPGTRPVPPAADLHQSRSVSRSVEVHVLGPVQVTGTLEGLEGRPRLTELVVYLALHPDGSTSEAFAAALWPERRVPPQTLANRLHEARRALGTTSGGVPRLQRSEGRHILAADVSTDWAKFCRLSDSSSGPASWRQALSLVRGRPFDGLARGEWTIFEGHVAAIESAVVEVAAKLGEHLLEAGDPLGAEWAIQRGLTVAPWDERLYRMRMAVADRLGNRGGVESVLRSLAQALDWRGDPLKIVHPETAALYRRLTDETGAGPPGL